MAAFMLAGRAFRADSAQQENVAVAVKVEARGELIIVAVNFNVPATPAEVWAVLTDYDRMADFLPNLDYSKKLEGTADTFQVEQKGQAFLGPFSFSFNCVQEVTLTPYEEIRSRLISGNFRQLDGQIQLIPSDDGTYIVYHGASIPAFHLPRSIAVTMTERAMGEHFGKMTLEILRRKNVAGK